MFMTLLLSISFTLLLFFFNDTATTEIYTLSLHDALPISTDTLKQLGDVKTPVFYMNYNLNPQTTPWRDAIGNTVKYLDRKSTRLNSSHSQISYAVFCLKKKKKK